MGGAAAKGTRKVTSKARCGIKTTPPNRFQVSPANSVVLVAENPNWRKVKTVEVLLEDRDILSIVGGEVVWFSREL